MSKVEHSVNPTQRSGRFCNCVSHGCGQQVQLDPDSGRPLRGKYISEREYQTHRKEDKWLVPRGERRGGNASPNNEVLAAADATTAKSEVHDPASILREARSQYDGSSSEQSSTTGDNVEGKKRLKSKVSRTFERVSNLRAVFQQRQESNLSVVNLVFAFPPNADSPSSTPAAVELGNVAVNTGPFSLRYGVSQNMRILEYESWLVEHLVRVDSVPTHEKDVLILSVESLKADILHELERLQDLKYSVWETQRDSLRENGDSPADPKDHSSSTGILTDRYLRHPLRKLDAICVACYVLIAILLLICQLSAAECGFVLTAMQVIVELCFSFHRDISVAAQRVLKSIPSDVRTVVDTLDLHPSAKSFVCCPSCFCLHDIETCPELCTHRQTPSSAPCNSKLRKMHTIKGKPFSVPVRCYHYHDLKEWIGEFICRPGIEDLIDRDVYSNPVDNDGKMRDVWDGEVLRAFKGPDGKPFISKNGDEGRYIFSLAMDGFNPRRSKAAGKRVSSVGVYMVCLNLPLEHRYLVENMFLVGVIPGPTEPSLNEINHLLKPLVDDLQVFWESGVWYSSTVNHPGGRRVRCAIVPLVCDLLASRQMAGFASHNTLKHFCLFCRLHLHDIENLDYTTWGTRDWAEHLRWAEAWRDAASDAERDAIFEEHGVRYSELLRLPYWNPILFAILDAMHALFLGNLKRHCRTIWGMDVKFEDGDGSEGDVLNARSDEPSEEALKRGQIALRTQSKSTLGACAVSVLKRLAKNTGALRYSGKKKRLLRDLLEYRVKRGWFDANGRMVVPPQPGELPQISNSVDTTSGPSQEQMIAANNFLSSAPTTESLHELTKAMLVALCLQRFESLQRQVLERENKTQLTQRLAELRFQSKLADASGRLLLPNAEQLAIARKTLSVQKKTKILGTDRLRAIWEDMETTILPTWMPAAPHHIGDGRHGKITADQWRTFCTVHLVVTLCRIWGPLEGSGRLHQFLDNFMDLVTAVKLATMRSVSHKQIHQYEDHYLRYLRQLLVLFPGVGLSPNQHFAVHFKDQFRTFGPAHSVWSFFFERVNHMLQQINKNNKLGQMEKTMFQRFCMAQRLRALLHDQSLPFALQPLTSAFQKIFASTSHGTLLNDVLSFEAMAQEAAPGNATDNNLRGVPPKEQRLTTEVVNLLSQFYSAGLEFGRRVPIPRPYGLLRSQYSLRGVSYTPYSSSPRDSHVILGSAASWDAGAIHSIVTHTLDAQNRDATTKTFFVVQRYKSLNAQDLAHDHYRAFPLAGGRLYYDELDLNLELLRPNDIACHFAKTPYMCKDIKAVCIHVLPLDRVPPFIITEPQNSADHDLLVTMVNSFCDLGKISSRS